MGRPIEMCLTQFTLKVLLSGLDAGTQRRGFWGQRGVPCPTPCPEAARLQGETQGDVSGVHCPLSPGPCWASAHWAGGRGLLPSMPRPWHHSHPAGTVEVWTGLAFMIWGVCELPWDPTGGHPEMQEGISGEWSPGWPVSAKLYSFISWPTPSPCLGLGNLHSTWAVKDKSRLLFSSFIAV